MPTLSESLQIEIQSMAQEYIRKGNYVVLVRKGFVEEIGKKLPYLGCLGKNGASMQVKAVLIHLGYEVKPYGSGRNLVAFLRSRDVK